MFWELNPCPLAYVESLKEERAHGLPCAFTERLRQGPEQQICPGVEISDNRNDIDEVGQSIKSDRGRKNRQAKAALIVHTV